jgi:hypothetical protein
MLSPLEKYFVRAMMLDRSQRFLGIQSAFGRLATNLTRSSAGLHKSDYSRLQAICMASASGQIRRTPVYCRRPVGIDAQAAWLFK